MLVLPNSEPRIIFPERNRRTIIQHCIQVLSELKEENEGKECKAFGLVCGTATDQLIKVESCLPLQRNVRSQAPYKEYMDRVMIEHAIPSKTPFDQRGWVADPAELAEKLNECRRNQHTLLGTYHMHRVAWAHDPVRDTPTKLDMVLGQESRLLMFIISMVDPEQPIIRAFYEGIKTREIPISS